MYKENISLIRDKIITGVCGDGEEEKLWGKPKDW